LGRDGWVSANQNAFGLPANILLKVPSLRALADEEH